jgi:hypothetical protein
MARPNAAAAADGTSVVSWTFVGALTSTRTSAASTYARTWPGVSIASGSAARRYARCAGPLCQEMAGDVPLADALVEGDDEWFGRRRRPTLTSSPAPTSVQWSVSACALTRGSMTRVVVTGL